MRARHVCVCGIRLHNKIVYCFSLYIITYRGSLYLCLRFSLLFWPPFTFFPHIYSSTTYIKRVAKGENLTVHKNIYTYTTAIKCYNKHLFFIHLFFYIFINQQKRKIRPKKNLQKKNSIIYRVCVCILVRQFQCYTTIARLRS